MNDVCYHTLTWKPAVPRGDISSLAEHRQVARPGQVRSYAGVKRFGHTVYVHDNGLAFGEVREYSDFDGFTVIGRSGGTLVGRGW